MTREEVEALPDEELMKLLASECGILTESQLRAFFESLCTNTEQTLDRYGFGMIVGQEVVLNQRGIIAAEVVDRFMNPTD